MTYLPIRGLETTPASLGWAYEDVTLAAGDGVQIHGWFVPAPAASARPPVTVLFLHGNAGNLSHRLDKLAILREIGADVLIVDYRGYGQSEGRPDEAGLRRDARAAYDHLVGARHVRPSEIVLYGESLGSAVAVPLAADVEVGGVVLEAAFTSGAEVAQAMFPLLPMRWLLRHRFDTIGTISRLRAPVLVLHSRGDEYFPLQHAERLVAAAGSRARMVVLRGTHNEAYRTSAGEYRQALERFLAERRQTL